VGGSSDQHRRLRNFRRPLRGLARNKRGDSQGSRTRPGLHAFARYAGYAPAVSLQVPLIKDRVIYWPLFFFASPPGGK
jgi:hypothetical protein